MLSLSEDVFVFSGSVFSHTHWLFLWLVLRFSALLISLSPSHLPSLSPFQFLLSLPFHSSLPEMQYCFFKRVEHLGRQGFPVMSTRGDPWARGALSLSLYLPERRARSRQPQDLGVGTAVYSVLFTKRKIRLPAHLAALHPGCGNPFPTPPPDPTTAPPPGACVLQRGPEQVGSKQWFGWGHRQAASVDSDLHKITGLQPEPEHM